MKICLVASGGGHFSQLLKLSKSWKNHETFYITTSQVMRDKLQELGEVYVVGECNRNHPIRVLKVFMKCIRIIFSERPDVVISTGAAVGCMVCFLGKLIGAKIIWIDSITNVQRISLSGRMVRHIANLFIVQWPELAREYKNVEYIGTVI